MATSEHGGGVIGCDLYNQTLTGQVAMTIRSKVGDYDHTPCVIARSNANWCFGFRSKAGPEWIKECAPTVLETIYKDGGEMVFLSGSNAKVGESKEG